MKNKRLLCGLICAVLLICLAAPALAEWGTVSGTSTLNVRSGPGKNYSRTGTVRKGEWVQTLYDYGDFVYAYIPSQDLYGYLSGTYLSPARSSRPGVVYGLKSSSSYLNLRAYASDQAPVIAKYRNGTTVTVLDDSTPGWYLVDTGYETGYFSSQYVKTESPTGTLEAWVSTSNGGNLNLRSEPVAGSKVLASVKNGTRVSVLMKGIGWYMVSVNGRTGFMDASFLKESSPVDPDPGTAWCRVNNASASSYLNLRASASTSSKALAKYKNGDKLEILSAGSEWCKVRDSAAGKTGYMMTKYIKLYNVSISRVVTNGSSYVNLRSRASTGSTSLMKIYSGKKVTVLVPGDTWTKVKYNGTTGYMMTRFLK